MTSIKKGLETWLQRLTAFVFTSSVVIFMIFRAGLGETRSLLALAGFVMMALACLAVGVVVHEMGHLACAAIGSIPVYRVTIGDGPVLWRRRIRDIWFEVRPWPLFGRVEPYSVMNYRRYRWALYILGGALANLVVLGVVLGLRAIGATGPVLDFLLFVQVFHIATTIVPLPGGGGNDGMKLVRLPWRPACDPAALRKLYDATIGGYSPGQAPPPMTAASVRLLHHACCFWTEVIPRAEARGDLMHELERGDLSPEETMWLLDVLVTEGITSSDPAARPYLDAWSQQALAMGPDRPTLQGSRGGALVELGRHEEGKPLLVPLAAPDQAASYDSFMSRVFLALAEHGLGNDAAARQLADAARATAAAAGISKAGLLARLDREIPPVNA